ncbi:MAG TPA: hypothetical protein VI298_04540 [Geobacteraceae bacterium]
MKRIIKLFVLISINLLTIICVSACTKGKESQPAITKTQHTIISLRLDYDIDFNKNLIYCASFQMAWNAMRDQIIKGDIMLEPDTLLAKQLNRQIIERKDMSQGSYVAVAGELSNDLIDRINKELQEKFGSQAEHGLDVPQATSSARQLIAYAFLYKNLEFPTEFEILNDPIVFTANGRETLVKGFGVNLFTSSKRQHEKLSNQVAILDYRNENDFILSLTSKSDDDQIILAKVAPNKTLLQTYAAVLDRMGKAKASELRDGETLRIPKIDFDLSHNFDELQNKRIMNKGWEGWFIAKAAQDIRFKLDEKGAVLKSTGFLSMLKAEAPPSAEKPRKFIFDKPFLIYLRQKIGSYPYFAMWVSNPELFGETISATSAR